MTLCCLVFVIKAIHSQILSKSKSSIVVGNFLNLNGASKMREIHPSINADVYNDVTPENAKACARILQQAQTREFTLWSQHLKMEDLCRNVLDKDWDRFFKTAIEMTKECGSTYNQCICYECSVRNSLLQFFVENIQMGKQTLKRLLFFARETSDIGLAQALVNQGVDVNGTLRSYRFESVLHGCIFGDVTFAKFLLENGADVNLLDIAGCSALVKLVELMLLLNHGEDMLCVFELFLQYGANIHAVTFEGTTVIEMIEEAAAEDVSVAKFALEILKKGGKKY